MMLYPLFKRLPPWALALLGVAFVALGVWFDTLTVSARFLFPLGLKFDGCYSGDYFPSASLFPLLRTPLPLDLPAPSAGSHRTDAALRFPEIIQILPEFMHSTASRVHVYVQESRFQNPWRDF